jgi:hypothetical protein
MVESSSSAHTLEQPAPEQPAPDQLLPALAYSRLLDEFPAVVCPSKRILPVSHDVVHHIIAGAKQALLSATHLAHPTVGAELSVVVDASATHVGACLQQQLPARRDWQPLGFFSKKLEAAQQKYSAFDRELFACYAAIRHFRYMLDGSSFSRTTSRSPMPWRGCLTRGQHTNTGSCPTWQSIHQISATSPGQPTWWQILSPGRPDTWRRRGLPQRGPV